MQGNEHGACRHTFNYNEHARIAWLSAAKWSEKRQKSERRNKNSSFSKGNTDWDVEKSALALCARLACLIRVVREKESSRCCNALDIFTIYQIQCNNNILLLRSALSASSVESIEAAEEYSFS